MKPATLEEKRELIRQSRGQNYRESLRLEGIKAPTHTSSTKAEVIARYKKGENYNYS